MCAATLLSFSHPIVQPTVDISTRELEPLVRWLAEQGAQATQHSGRTLLEHLVGTYRLLRAAGQPEAVRLGGLFHSVYGTNAFTQVTVSHARRAEVRALIGWQAESLAWAFGRLDRPRAIVQALRSGTLPTGAEIAAANVQMAIAALATMECANLLEQGELARAPELVAHARAVGLVSDFGFSVLC